jgi:Nucleotidyl transferase AbiEii toxin, Type IV TA system
VSPTNSSSKHSKAWKRLLEHALHGIDALAEGGVVLRWWTFGGGTALMAQHQHRNSKDIDLFIPDPQYLNYLSPRLGGERVWYCEDYDEAAHYLKLRYKEGEIDFIVADRLSDMEVLTFEFAGWNVPMEHAVEIAVKKLFHRAAGLKPRDIFDVAVVMHRHGKDLERNLPVLSVVRDALEHRLRTMPEPYYERALDELEISPAWEHLKTAARGMVGKLVSRIPAAP